MLGTSALSPCYRVQVMLLRPSPTDAGLRLPTIAEGTAPDPDPVPTHHVCINT